MATKAKPQGAGKKRGNGSSVKEQINGLDPSKTREFFDQIHGVLDEADEAAATFRGQVGRIYEKACDKLDISKDALKLVFQEERAQRKKEAKAAKMDTRARDSLERLGAAMGDSPMGQWATKMAKLAGNQEATQGA